MQKSIQGCQNHSVFEGKMIALHASSTNWASPQGVILQIGCRDYSVPAIAQCSTASRNNTLRYTGFWSHLITMTIVSQLLPRAIAILVEPKVYSHKKSSQSNYPQTQTPYQLLQQSNWVQNFAPIYVPCMTNLKTWEGDEQEEKTTCTLIICNLREKRGVIVIFILT